MLIMLLLLLLLLYENKFKVNIDRYWQILTDKVNAQTLVHDCQTTFQTNREGDKQGKVTRSHLPFPGISQKR